MRPNRWLRPAAETAALLAATTALLAPVLGGGHITVVSLVYLAATLALAARWGYAVGFGAAIASNLAVNFFFVEPLHRLAVANGDNVAALAVFLAVAAIGAYMLSRARQEAARARANEADTEALLRVTREVADARTPRLALDHLCKAAARAVGARGCALLSSEGWVLAGSTLDAPSNSEPTPDERAAAAEAWRRKEPVGLAQRPGERQRTFVPIEGPELAVLRLVGEVERDALAGSLFIGLANELRATLRRARLDEAAGRARELERSGEFKSLLLTSVSHDLRTPLTAIKAAVSSLRDPAVEWRETDREAFLETIESQADRLSKTVSNLLEISRLESGPAPASELIEVGPLLDEAAMISRPTGHEVRVCPPRGLWVRADYGLLMQAIGNLLENAARYGDPGSAIDLAASSSPGRVYIAVSNSGPPIDPADLPHIFERSYRGKRAAEGGSGLGLALVRAIVEGAGGSVAAASDEERTAFTISLPAAAAPK